MANPGGGETQLRELARSLRDVGVEARLWRPWEDRLAEADCLHLFGSTPQHATIVAAARRHRLPVVLSPIAWFDLASRWHEHGPLPRRVAACGALVARRLCCSIPSWRRRLYQSVDLLLPNSVAEADQLRRYFGISSHRIRVVPNGADPRFADASPEPFARRVAHRDFALYAGRIEPRKNQLGFLRAMRGSGVPIVVLGDAVAGHEDYAAQCRREADEWVTFVGAVDHDDPLLASAYAACACLVLASWYETPGLVALEAAMTGAPLVLTSRGSAREYFGDRARYVSPARSQEIRRAVLASCQLGRSPELARLVLRHFTWQAAAEATRDAYAEVL